MSENAPIDLSVIVASTRPGRIGLPIGAWAAEVAARDARFDVRLVDLAEVALPLLDEPNHPRLAQYEHDHTKRWAEIIGSSDAFVFVTPEYNHSFPATLKNAIDYLHNEWQHKPVGFVSYGGISGGIRAVEALIPVCTALRMTPVVEGVVLPFPFGRVDDEGRFIGDGDNSAAADAMLGQLAATARRGS